MARSYEIRTAQDFADKVQLGATTESDVLDFKGAIGLPRQGNGGTPPIEIAKDIVAFANAWGGCLLIGVEEGMAAPGQARTAARVVGVPDPNELHKWLDTKVRNLLDPGSLPFTVDHILLPGGSVVAVNIPGFHGCAAVWDRGEKDWIMYPYRVSFGNRTLTPAEVEERMASESIRATELRLVRLLTPQQTLISVVSAVAVPRRENAAEKKARLVAAERLHRTIPPSEANREVIVFDDRYNLPARFIAFGLDDFEVELQDSGRGVTIPYGSVLRAWRQLDGRVALQLDLRVVIPQDSTGHVYLRPL